MTDEMNGVVASEEVLGDGGVIMRMKDDERRNFEHGRIRTLQEERMHIQKKTFTNWINSYLLKVRMQIDDIFVDLSDGVKLLRLLEIISGERLSRPNSGRTRVHHVENINRSLAFLHTKVRLESIGAEDVVDGNPRLILGLVWTIILRFQIGVIDIDMCAEQEGLSGDSGGGAVEAVSSEVSSARDALLLWCQRATANHAGVCIRDFSASWRSGLAFLALLHAHRPDLVDFAAVDPSDHLTNLRLAFSVASERLGIHQLLDAEDTDVDRPDEKSVMTYIASYYHTFARLKSELRGGRRIANIIARLMRIDERQRLYTQLVGELIAWIDSQIVELDRRDFDNRLASIQQLLATFTRYRTVQKPPQLQKRNHAQVLLFDIGVELQALSRPAFQPRDGHLPRDIERHWSRLESAEHSREMALRDQLRRQHSLHQLAARFERKCSLRRSYVDEMVAMLSQPLYGRAIGQVDAAVKKHEAISADVLTRAERLAELESMADRLERERYADADRVRATQQATSEQWSRLLALLQQHQVALAALSTVCRQIRDVQSLRTTLFEMREKVRPLELGDVNLSTIDEMIQQHTLLDAQVVGMATAVQRIGVDEEQLTPVPEHSSQPHQQQVMLLKEELQQLHADYTELRSASTEKRLWLEELRKYDCFVGSCEEQLSWLCEQRRLLDAITAAAESPGDLSAALSLQQRHRTIDDQLRRRQPQLDQIIQPGEHLAAGRPQLSADIGSRVHALRLQYDQLQLLSSETRQCLSSAVGRRELLADLNESESWLRERLPLAASEDYGDSEAATAALLARHRDILGQIAAYRGEIDALLTQTAIEPDQVRKQRQDTAVLQEYWDEERVERVEYKTVTVERQCAQVIALYPYSGHGLSVSKGQTMLLISRTNSDWWHVRTSASGGGADGFVPANYVRESTPKVVNVKVKQPHTVVDVRRVKKTRLVNSGGEASPSAVVGGGSGGGDVVPQRISSVEDLYERLSRLADRRLANLNAALAFHSFVGECEQFESWLCDRQHSLQVESAASTDKIAPGDEWSATLSRRSHGADLSSAERRMEAVNTLAGELLAQQDERLSCSYTERVQQRQQHVDAVFERFRQVSRRRDRSVRVACSVGQLVETGDQLISWLSDKSGQLQLLTVSSFPPPSSSIASGSDRDILGALERQSRRHEQFERELTPLGDQVLALATMADATISADNQLELEQADADRIVSKRGEVERRWRSLVADCDKHRRLLAASRARSAFHSHAQYLSTWLSGVSAELEQRQDELAAAIASDVHTVSDWNKTNAERMAAILSRGDDLSELSKLADEATRARTACDEDNQQQQYLDESSVEEVCTGLSDEYRRVLAECGRQSDQLRDLAAVLAFTSEARRLDVLTAASEAIVAEWSRDQDADWSLDAIDASLKQHEYLAGRLAAQQQRADAFASMADQLVESGHERADEVQQRRHSLLQRREQMLIACVERRRLLLAARRRTEFTVDCRELAEWTADKIVVVDADLREQRQLQERCDGARLSRRCVRRHTAIVDELCCNETCLQRLQRVGDELLTTNTDATHRQLIERTLADLTEQWSRLQRLVDQEAANIEQATRRASLSERLHFLIDQMQSLSTGLQKDELGNDVLTCKQLMTEHLQLQKQLKTLHSKCHALSESMNAAATKDSSTGMVSLQDQCSACLSDLVSLSAPCDKRGSELAEALECYRFLAVVDSEHQWIDERQSTAEASLLGASLVEAQRLQKRQSSLSEEVRTHRSVVVDSVVTRGEALVSRGDLSRRLLDGRCDGLLVKWHRLEATVNQRRNHLQASVDALKVVAGADEIAGWLGESAEVLSSEQCGGDEKATVRLLESHKSTERQLDTYAALLTELCLEVDSMSTDICSVPSASTTAPNDSNTEVVSDFNPEHQERPHLALVQRRRAEVCQQLEQCRELASVRLHRLVRAKHVHELVRECGEMLAIIDEWSLEVDSDEFGVNFNELTELQKRFSVLKRHVETSAERFTQLDQSANRLMADFQADTVADLAVMVSQQRQRLRSAWQRLMQLLEARERKLAAAGDLHRFNGDVADSLQQVGAKCAQIDEDDSGCASLRLQDVQASVRAHELLDTSLVGVEAQLQLLVNDSCRLQQLYPSNAEHLEEQRHQLVSSWEELQSRADLRRRQLSQRLQMAALAATADGLSVWMEQQCATLEGTRAMAADEQCGDLELVQQWRDEHDRLATEMESRQPSFRQTVDRVNLLLADSTDRSADSLRICADRLIENQRMFFNKWHQLKILLDQVLDYHLFIREASGVEGTTQQYESLLTNDLRDIHATADKPQQTSSVDKAEQQVRRHEALCRRVEQLHERVSTLACRGDKLLAQNHCRSAEIAGRLAECRRRDEYLERLVRQRSSRFERQLLMARLARDIDEARHWVSDRRAHLLSAPFAEMYTTRSGADTDTDAADSLMAKIRRLQKQQSFQAECNAHQSRISAIATSADRLLLSSEVQRGAAAESNDSLRQLVNTLLVEWQQLLDDSQRQARGLEEARDLLAFHTDAQWLDGWMRENTLQAEACVCEATRDYEHCRELQQRVGAIASGVRQNQARVDSIQQLAGRLSEAGESTGEWSVQSRCSSLLERWCHLQATLETCRQRLSEQLDVHRFDRDLTDTRQRIQERRAGLASVVVDGSTAWDRLSSRHDECEREVTAIGQQLDRLAPEAKRLTADDSSDAIDGAVSGVCRRLDEAIGEWRELSETTKKRRQLLSVSGARHHFMTDLNSLVQWCDQMVVHIVEADESVQLSRSAASAALVPAATSTAGLVHAHHERKVEIDSRHKVFDQLLERGRLLATKSDVGGTDELEARLHQLVVLRERVITAWRGHRDLLHHSADLDGFNVQLQRANVWLDEKEGEVNSADLGDSVVSVGRLLRQHQQFVETFSAQHQETVSALKKSAVPLLPEKDRASVKAPAHDSKHSCHKPQEQLIGNENGHRQGGGDQREETSNTQRHKPQEQLIGNGNGHRQDQEDQREVDNSLEPNEEQEHMPAQNETYDLKHSERSEENSSLKHHIEVEGVQEHEHETDENEEPKEVHDHSRTLDGNQDISHDHKHATSISSLCCGKDERNKKHSKANDTDEINERISTVDINGVHNEKSSVNQVYAEDQHNQDHRRLSSDNIQSQYRSDIAVTVQSALQTVLTRCDEITSKASQRQNKLEASLQYQQLTRTLTEVDTWIGEQMTVALDESAYRERTNLKSKLRRHQALQSEVASNEARFTGACSEARQLIDSGHCSGEEVASRLLLLTGRWTQLEEATALKEVRLREAHEAVLFVRRLDELDAWTEGVETRLASEDHGDSVSAVDALLTAHRSLEAEIATHRRDTLPALSEQVTQFVEQNHYDVEAINRRHQTVVDRVGALVEPCEIRLENLEDARRLYRYLDDVGDEFVWLEEQRALVESEDTGDSLAEAQQLLTEHFTLQKDLAARCTVVDQLAHTAQTLVDSGHFASANIERKQAELRQLCDAVVAAAESRRCRLQAARQSQQLYVDAGLVSRWLQQHERSIGDSGQATTTSTRDLAACQAALKRLAALLSEWCARQAVVSDQLSPQCATLLDSGHFDSERLKSVEEQLVTRCADFGRRLTARIAQIEYTARYHTFCGEANRLSDWLSTQLSLAASEEYGNDVVHVQILIDQFAAFTSSLNSGEQRVADIEESASHLLADKHPQSEEIKSRAAELRHMYGDVCELAEARREALLGARQVHTFDHTADETISWISSKHAQLSSASSTAADGGDWLVAGDSDAVARLQTRHLVFERDLAALCQHMKQLASEWQRLTELFPDAGKHVAAKHGQAVLAWNQLLDAAAQHKQRLQEAGQLAEKLQQAAELLAWIGQLLGRVTAPRLADNVSAAQMLLARHGEHHAEMKARHAAVIDCVTSCRTALSSDAHFMTQEVHERASLLEDRFAELERTVERRAVVYGHSLDVLQFQQSAACLDEWLSSRQHVLDDGELGESIARVDELIERHDRFVESVESQSDYLAAIQRLTLVEEEFARVQCAEREERERAETARQQERLLHLAREQQLKMDRQKQRAPINVAESGGSIYAELKSLIKGGGRSVSGHGVNAGVGDPVSKHHRIPSFNTRRRLTHLARVKHQHQQPQQPVTEEQQESQQQPEMAGVLARKHELQSGGRRATLRSWREHYTTLTGRWLRFHRDWHEWADSRPQSAPAIDLRHAQCQRALDYSKRRWVFRVVTADRAEYLFACDDPVDGGGDGDAAGSMFAWMAAISQQIKPVSDLPTVESSPALPDNHRPVLTSFGGERNTGAPAVKPRSNIPPPLPERSTRPVYQNIAGVVSRSRDLSPPPPLPESAPPVPRASTLPEPRAPLDVDQCDAVSVGSASGGGSSCSAGPETSQRGKRGSVFGFWRRGKKDKPTALV